MHYLKYYYTKNLKYELVNKFFYHKLKNLPKRKKMVLNFNCQTDEIKTISTSLLALELLTNQKGFLTKTNKTNLFTKTRKGSPTGCKITLRKNRLLSFLTKNCSEFFPKQKNFNGLKLKTNKNSFSYQITNLLNFSNIEEHYYLFNNLKKINVTLVIENSKNAELLFIIKSLSIPLKNANITQLGRV